jgi:cyclopropane-fatty-acyl-phospholipid synthase
MSQNPRVQQSNSLVIQIFNRLQLLGAEAYINGLEPSDLILKGWLDGVLDQVQRHYPQLFVSYDWLLRESEQLAEGSRELMKIQYDLPTTLFQLMLGESALMHPKYTMALWERGAICLEEAQRHMLDDIFAKVGVEDGDRILDLGCGWGSASNYLLNRFPNCQVTGLNLSGRQCDYLRAKQQDPTSAISSGRFTLCEQDFNQANFDQPFDKILAIGLFEHVGNLTQSFAKLASFLKPEGRVFVHFISSHLPYSSYSPFLNRYIFPRMRIWSYDEVPQHHQHLVTRAQWYLNGVNYAKTLQCWLANFDAHQQEIAGLDVGMDYAKFRRIWRLYLILCMAYFDMDRGRLLGNAQYLLEPAR